MPLDGEDEVGMFCILLPQPMDRSMKNLQAWRPYEIRNGGDGKRFDNKFMLLTLRYTNQDMGTLDLMRAALEPQEMAQVVSRIGSQAVAASNSVSDVVPTVENERPNQPPRIKSPKRSSRNRSTDSIDGQTKRMRKTIAGWPEAQSPKRVDLHRSMTKPVNVESEPPKKQYTPDPRDTPEHSTTPMPASIQEQPLIPNTSDRSEERHVLVSQLKDQSTRSGLTDEQANDINVVWKLDIEEDTWELPFTLAECRSFSGMLKVMNDMALSLPSAAALLGKTNLWRLTYPLPGGKRKSQMARKGTEVAFNRMQTDLAQSSLLDQGSIEVELEAIG
jgi:hypothetical protein